MPVREIRTTIAIDGEKKFRQALEEASDEMKVTTSELKKLAAQYADADDKQEYFTQKADVLQRKVEQEEEIVRALRNAIEELGKSTDYSSRTMDNYRMRLNYAEAKMFDLRREAEVANRELEELGRDSGRIGQQIERGIGDAAEDAADKVERMFAGVSEDIEAIKGSFAFQTTMSAGEFVVDAVSGVVDFVNENQELNRQIAIARHNIEQYDLNWDDVQGLIIRAAAITGNQDGAIEAVSNLASAGFDSEEMLKAAMDALLGVFLTTGGSLSFESLAEDFRASVVARTPTGTYAEVIEEVLQGVAVEEVEKALQAAETTDEAIQIALSVLTSGGMQTKTKSFEDANAEMIEAQIKTQELALKQAALAQELTPIVNAFVDGMISAVDAAVELVQYIKGKEDMFGMTREEFSEESRKKTGGVFRMDEEQGIIRTDFGDAFKNLGEGLLELLIPSAGAEEMTGEWEAQGEKAVNALELGMMSKAQESTTADGIMKGMVEDMSAENENANTAGVNMMTQFANGVAEGSTAAISNVADMVNQINALLAQVGSVAYGAGFAATGGGVQLTVDGNDLSTVVSANTGRKVQATMLVK